MVHTYDLTLWRLRQENFELEVLSQSIKQIVENHMTEIWCSALPVPMSSLDGCEFV